MHLLRFRRFQAHVDSTAARTVRAVAAFLMALAFAAGMSMEASPASAATGGNMLSAGQTLHARQDISIGNAILNAAASMNGKPYCWAGGNTSGPTHGQGNGGDEATDCGALSIKGFDCGGLAIYAVYQATHITITRTTIQNFGTRVKSISQLQPGDVILFGGTWNSYAHVGIYAGNGYMWNANTAPSQDVQKIKVSWETAALNFIGAVRF